MNNLIGDIFIVIIVIASAHVQCKTLADYMAIANQLKEFFHNEGIHSTTIQPEFNEQPQIEDGSLNNQMLKDCILECDPDCAERMCCTTNQLDITNNKKDMKIVIKAETDESVDLETPSVTA